LREHLRRAVLQLQPPAKSARKKKDKNRKKRGETRALITSKRNLGASMPKMDSIDILLDALDANHAIGKKEEARKFKVSLNAFYYSASMTLIANRYPPPATPSPSGLIQGYVPRASTTRQRATPSSSNSHSLADNISTLGSPLGHGTGVEFNSITGYESLDDDGIEL
jgi:hypothetical protein